MGCITFSLLLVTLNALELGVIPVEPERDSIRLSETTSTLFLDVNRVSHSVYALNAVRPIFDAKLVACCCIRPMITTLPARIISWYQARIPASISGTRLGVTLSLFGYLDCRRDKGVLLANAAPLIVVMFDAAHARRISCLSCQILVTSCQYHETEAYLS